MPRPARSAECHPDRKHVARGLCKSCYTTQNRRENPRARQRAREALSRWQRSHKEERQSYKREWLLAQYGLTPAEYDALLEKQQGKCAICGCLPKTGTVLAVDHDHRTGKVRGLLCTSCNNGLGRFMDDPYRLRKAAEYLEKEAIHAE